jgi:hypothetical protein
MTSVGKHSIASGFQAQPLTSTPRRAAKVAESTQESAAQRSRSGSGRSRHSVIVAIPEAGEAAQG